MFEVNICVNILLLIMYTRHVWLLFFGSHDRRSVNIYKGLSIETNEISEESPFLIFSGKKGNKEIKIV